MIVGAIESEFPVPTFIPPQELAYHLKLSPLPPMYESIVFSPLQIVCSVAETDVGCVGLIRLVRVTSEDKEDKTFSF